MDGTLTLIIQHNGCILHKYHLLILVWFLWTLVLCVIIGISVGESEEVFVAMICNKMWSLLIPASCNYHNRTVL